jgi:hypothetical protein
LLLSVILATTLGASGTAHAEPLDANPIAGEETTFPWTALGLPREVTMVGANATQEYSLPVPSGFNARRLRGLIHAPVDLGAGFVEINDGAGRFLATVDLPAVAPDQVVVPFDVDISAAQSIGSTLGLSFTVREADLPPEQRCGLGQRLVISDLVAVFAGEEPAPSTVATFFPPVLERLAIYAPVDASGAEQQAVLTLTSAVARMYRSQSTTITVASQPRGATPPPSPRFTRTVVVESGDAGLNVINAGRPEVHLKLTGRGDQLTDQTSLLINQLQSLVQVPSARVDQAGSDGDSGSDVMTFAQLGLKGESQVLRTSDLTVGVDRSALGSGRVDGLQVHLLATHTPVAALDSASLMVRVNGQAVYTTALDNGGRVDALFDVPVELLRQRVNLEFGLTFSPRQLCSPTIAPMTFQLDPRSTLTMRRGGQAPGGFGAVPSEFSPEFLVALDGGSPSQLDYATRVVADIARRTGTTLMPRVVDVKSAADATTGALIVANAATLEQTSLRPPIGGASSDVQIDLNNELRAEINSGLGSIQAFADHPRNRTVILVSTSGAWTLVEPLLGYIDQLPDGWSSLEGNVAAAGADGTVTNLSIGSDDTSSDPSQDEPTRWPTWLAIGAGCLVLVALGLGSALWLRRRRSGAAANTETESMGPGLTA